jgi:hypothetical protein
MYDTNMVSPTSCCESGTKKSNYENERMISIKKSLNSLQWEELIQLFQKIKLNSPKRYFENLIESDEELMVDALGWEMSEMLESPLSAKKRLLRSELESIEILEEYERMNERINSAKLSFEFLKAFNEKLESNKVA